MHLHKWSYTNKPSMCVKTFLHLNKKGHDVIHGVIMGHLCSTWLEDGAHFPPGPVLQGSQELCRVKGGLHLWGAVKQALSPDTRNQTGSR